MATLLVEAQSRAPGSSKITLVDGLTTTGFKLMEGADWGNAAWDRAYSGPRGTQGGPLASAEPVNRAVSLPFQITATTHLDLEDKAAVLWRLADEMRRFGGTLTFRPEGGTYKQYFDVLDLEASIPQYGRLFHHYERVDVVLDAVCAPYLKWDAYDIFDDFSTNTIADYTLDAGTALSITGGAMVPGSSPATSRYRHTARGFSYSDVEATLKITTGASVTSGEWQVNINCDTTGVETMISAHLTTAVLKITKFVAGTETTLATTPVIPVANSTYWLKARREGRVVTAELFTTEPTPLATAAFVVPGQLTAAENQQFYTGQAGFKVATAHTSERYDEFRVEPYTYKLDRVLPDRRELRGTIVGDAPALADVSITAGDGISSVPIFALFAWWKRSLIWNRVANGDFEDDVDGWSVAGVTGITGAATSITRGTALARTKYGGANGAIVCPATANTGATYKIRQRFRQGTTYLLFLWAAAATATTTTRARLGVNGDVASSSSSPALTVTPTRYTAVWSPSATVDAAYAAFEITAATATTMNIDGVVVCEARQTTTSASLAGGFSVTVDRVPEDWPSAPFMAMIEPESQANVEIIRIEAISGLTLTIARGLEATTIVSHASGSTICPIPERPQLEGKGAQPAHGILECESADASNLFTWTVASNVAYRSGEYLSATGLVGTGFAFADWLIDPNLLTPDDYVGPELAVEVWARLQIDSGLGTPTAIISAAPETATVASGVLNSYFGHVRYAEEYGSAGKLLSNPSGTPLRFFRLGTLRFPVNRQNPLRARLGLKISWTGTAPGSICNADYLMLVPANSRALSPSGKVNDSDYPFFMESFNETTKTVKADLSGLAAKPPGAPFPDHGLGGSMLELPPGNVDAMVKLSNAVPDDPTGSSTEVLSISGVVHVAVTPRSRLARGS